MEDHLPILRVFLLGPFRLEVEQPDGKRRVVEDFEALLGRDLSATLFKLILVHPERRVKRDLLVRTMWPGHSLVSVRHSLEVTKSRLGRTLEDLCGRPLLPRAIGNPPVYTTASQSEIWTDLEACEETQSLALITRNPIAALFHWEEVYAFLQRGELLADETEAYWYPSPLIQDRCTKLTRLRRQCVLRIADLALECGNTNRALVVLTEECEAHPADEDLAFHVMTILARLGRLSSALARYTQLEAALSEREAVPREETKRLVRGLRAQGVIRGQSSGSFEETEVSGSVWPSKAGNRADEVGVQALLLPPIESASPIDWGEAPSPGPFYGRTKALVELEAWIQVQHCRVVAIFGMGGIGKTSLALNVVHLVRASFEYVFWRSLQHAPPLRSVLQDAITWLSSQHQTDFPQDTDTLISILLRFLQEHHCLLILDNCETILKSGTGTGSYRDGYQDYGRLFQRLGEGYHHSCLVLTSREKLREIALQTGEHTPVHAYHLHGLSPCEGVNIFGDKGLRGSKEAMEKLVDLYAGNPLALRLVSQFILEVFNGEISTFLSDGDVIFRDIEDILDQQVRRLSPLELSILYWLSIEREGTTLHNIHEKLVQPVSKRALQDAVNSLQRRHLIEISASGLTLQNVVMEYMTERLVEDVCEELRTGTLALCKSHALMQATAREYVRETQIHLIVRPIGEHLLMTFGRSGCTTILKDLLSQFRSADTISSSYAAGNILNLLIQSGCDLRGSDFSSLEIRQAYLQGVTLPEVNFAFSRLLNCVFTETFGSILSVAFSSEENLVAAGTANGEIRVWNTIDRALLHTLRGHTDWVRSISFSPNGHLLASGSEDQTVRLWDIPTGQCLHILQGHTNRVRSLAFSPNGSKLATGSEDQTVKIWETSTSQCLQTLQGHTDQVRSVAFDPNGNFLISGSEDQTVQLWDIPTGRCLNILQGHTGPIFAVAVSSDGKMIASGGEDQKIRLWDTGTGQCLKMLDEHAKKIRVVVFQPNGQYLASGAEDETIRLWDVKTGQCLKILPGHTSPIFSIAFRADGNLLVSGSEDQTVRLWEVTTGQCLNVLRGYADEIRSLAFSPKGDMIASGSEDHTVRLWDVSNGQNLRTLCGHSGRVRAVAFNPQEGIIASGSEDQTVRLWDISTGQCLQTLAGHTNRVRSVAFSPQGDIIASGSEDQTVRLWKWSTGQCLATLGGHTNRVRSVAFSPDGNLLASGGEDRTIQLWNVHTMHSLKILQGHTSWVWTIAFSPDGKTIASGCEDQSVYLWDIEKGTCLLVLQGHGSRIRTIAFSSDGKTLASGSEDQTIRLWDVGSGSCVKIFHGHTSWIWAVAFHPDGKTFASGGYDGTIKIWDVQTGNCLKTIRSARPYERMNITQAQGLTPAQKTMLVALGAIERGDPVIGERR